MRLARAALAASALALVAPATSARAEPVRIPIQGSLADADGVPIDATYEVALALYADAAATTPLWTETQDVTFTDGAFSAYLGSVAALDSTVVAAHPELRLGLAIDGDAELPRVALGTVPRAAWAPSAGDAASLGGHPADSYATRAEVTAVADAAVGKSDIEGFAEAVCYDTPAELRGALDTVYRSQAAAVPWSALDGVPAYVRAYSASDGVILSNGNFTLDAAYVGTLVDARAFGSAAEVRAALGGVRNVEEYPGADAGQKLQAALDALPATGGTIDARGLSGDQTITGLSIVKPVTLLLGHATFVLDGPIDVGAGVQFARTDSVKLIGSGGGRTRLVRSPAAVAADADFPLVHFRDMTAHAEVSGLTFDNGDVASIVVAKDGTIGHDNTRRNALRFAIGGSSDVAITDNAFLREGRTSSIFINSGDEENERFRIERNYLEADSTHENQVAMSIYGYGDFLRINGNTVVRAGSISVNPGYGPVTTERQLEICHNFMRDNHASNILVRTSTARHISNILVCDNSFEDAGGPGIPKGFIGVSENPDPPSAAKAAGSRIVITGNRGRGWYGNAILLAGSVTGADVHDVVIADNVFDGRLTDGSEVPTQGYGIQVRSFTTNVVVHDNVVRYSGLSGILFQGVTNGEVHDNIIEHAIRNSGNLQPTAGQIGGILLNEVHDVRVHHNRVIDAGTAAGPTSGIVVQDFGLMDASSGVLIASNVITDTQASPTTLFGIGIVTNLGNVRLSDNVVTGSIPTAISPAQSSYLHSGAAPTVSLTPARDAANYLTIDAGITAPQWGGLALQSGGTTKWFVAKNDSNQLEFNDATESGARASRMVFNPGGSVVLRAGSAAGSAVVIDRPYLDGGLDARGSGAKHVRVAIADQPTGRWIHGFSWPGGGFADASYTVSCTAESVAPSDFTVRRITAKSAASVSVEIEVEAFGSSGAIDCVAFHD